MSSCFSLKQVSELLGFDPKYSNERNNIIYSQGVNFDRLNKFIFIFHLFDWLKYHTDDHFIASCWAIPTNRQLTPDTSGVEQSNVGIVQPDSIHQVPDAMSEVSVWYEVAQVALHQPTARAVQEDIGWCDVNVGIVTNRLSPGLDFLQNGRIYSEQWKPNSFV